MTDTISNSAPDIMTGSFRTGGIEAPFPSLTGALIEMFQGDIDDIVEASIFRNGIYIKIKRINGSYFIKENNNMPRKITKKELIALFNNEN